MIEHNIILVFCIFETLFIKLVFTTYQFDLPVGGVEVS